MDNLIQLSLNLFGYGFIFGFFIIPVSLLIGIGWYLLFIDKWGIYEN